MYLVKKSILVPVRMRWWQSRSCVWKKRWETGSFRERKGVSSIQKKAYEYVLDHEMDTMVKSEFGRLQLALMRQVLTRESRCEEKIPETAGPDRTAGEGS